MPGQIETHDANGLALEAMIDAYGLQAVLAAVSEICHDKATHIAENWQDTSTAKRWTRAAHWIDQAANAIKDLI